MKIHKPNEDYNLLMSKNSFHDLPTQRLFELLFEADVVAPMDKLTKLYI